MKRSLKVWTVVYSLLGCSWLGAQTFQGGLRGSVSDPTGAAIGTAKVTLIDEATGVSRSTVSNTGGEYSFTAVNPAKYTVSVEAPGFKKLDRKGLVVSTQEFLIVDLKVEVGDVTQSVNVTEEVPLMETENASTGQVIDNQKLADLPNMGRNPFFEGVKISQAVTPGGDPKFNRMEDQSGSSTISIAGGPVSGNNYLLDGIPITDSTNRAVIIPSIEAVQEVKLQINTYDAEVGRTGGGTFNLFLKSGTNDLHGDVFGYTWVQSMLANTYFADAGGRNAAGQLNQPIANQPFYNYGAAIGGPVVIPKLYNGKNKTFFWFSGESYRQTEAATANEAVPTALEKVGNFSRSFTKSGALQQMYYPDPNGRLPFANNIIPQSMINPVGLALASYYPLPSQNPAYYGATDYPVTAVIYDRADQFTSKLDQQITQWWRASVSYLHYGSREESAPYFGYANPATPNQSMLVRHADTTQANTTITPSPTTVVFLRWGFNRFPNRTYQLASQGMNLGPGGLGFPSSLVSQLPYDAFPAITMSSDMSSYGSGSFTQYSYYSHSFSGTVSKFMGRHSLKTGMDYRDIHVSGLTSGVNAGAYSFSSAFTSASGTSTVPGTGGSLASMLLGFPSAGSVSTADPISLMVHYWGFFVQDDFRVNKKLTLNFGVRYEYETGLTSPLNSLVAFNPTAINPVQSQVTGISTPGEIVYAGTNGLSTVTHPNSDKWAPRIGAAYSLDEKTTIRGGYGLLWAPFYFSSFTPIGYTNSTPYVASTNNNVSPSGSLSNPFPTGILAPSGSSLGALAGLGGQTLSVYDGNAHSTRIHQYSFDIQRELPGNFVVSAGYSGSITHNLIQGTPAININQLPDQYLSMGGALNNKVANPFYGTIGGTFNLASSTISQSQLLLPYPQFGPVNYVANSSDQNHALYNSVYIKVQKRLTHGLNLLSSYTWSKNMDESNNASVTFNAQQAASQDNYNRAAEWGLATINTPGRWTTAVNYQLPFGRGQKFLSHGRLMDLAVGGWAMNIQTTMQTGFPMAIYQNNLNSAIGTSVQRPNATGVSAATSGSLEQRLYNYLNPAAFSLAGQYTYGNVSRTIPIRGPGMANTDFSLFKSWGTERYKGQFRMEVFNLTNTPQFYAPGADGFNTGNEVGSASFGQIGLQANFPRVVQMGIRAQF
jgi:hypothetical protein